MLIRLVCCHALDDEPSMSVCVTIWCDRPAVARGLCHSCYNRLRKGISTAAPARGYAVAHDKERLRAEITRRREAGESIPDIAAAIGINTATASRWLREWDVAVGRREDARPANLWRPWARDDIGFAVSRTDLTIAERAAALGRSVASIEEINRKEQQRSSRARVSRSSEQ